MRRRRRRAKERRRDRRVLMCDMLIDRWVAAAVSVQLQLAILPLSFSLFWSSSSFPLMIILLFFSAPSSHFVYLFVVQFHIPIIVIMRMNHPPHVHFVQKLDDEENGDVDCKPWNKQNEKCSPLLTWPAEHEIRGNWTIEKNFLRVLHEWTSGNGVCFLNCTFSTSNVMQWFAVSHWVRS